MGSMAFTAQYLQRPAPEEGNLIKWKWFEYYDELPAWRSGDRVIQSWDTALTANELSDYSVCTTWLVRDNNYYLLDVYRKRLEYPDLVHAIVRHKRKFNAKPILIEDAASGKSLIPHLRREATDLRVTKVKPEKDKVTRMKMASIEIESGKVFLPEKAPWMGPFQKELMAFPGSSYDDQVDSVSQFLNWVTKPRGMVVKPLGGL